MADTDSFVGALQRLIDSLEDTHLTSSQALVKALESIEPRVWLQLAREGRIDAISQTLGIDIATTMLPLAEAAALDAATALSGRNARSAIAPVTGSRLWGPESSKRAARRVVSLLSDEMTTAQNKIRRLIAEVPPTSRSAASTLLDRIEMEVVAPLRQPGVWTETLNSAAMTAGDEALSAAQVRLREPALPPDAAHQRALDAPHAWVCALVKTCPDCLPRHGQVDTASNWRNRGMPRSGWSVCRGYCRCQLVPVFDGTGAIDVPSHAKLAGPLQREKMHLIADGTPRGLTVAVPRDLLKEEPGTLKGKDKRRDLLRRKYESDIRVRRAMRILGSVNAGGE